MNAVEATIQQGPIRRNWTVGMRLGRFRLLFLSFFGTIHRRDGAVRTNGAHTEQHLQPHGLIQYTPERKKRESEYK